MRLWRWLLEMRCGRRCPLVVDEPARYVHCTRHGTVWPLHSTDLKAEW